jgi:hypothetical protein
MKSMDNLVKGIRSSLSLLDNHYVKLVLTVLLVAYSSGLVPSINREVSVGLSNMWVRALVLLLIMYVSVKDVALAMLLSVAFVLTVHMSGGNVEGMENSGPSPASEEEEGDATEDESAEPFASVEGMEGGSQMVPSGFNSDNKQCLQDCANGDSLPTSDVSGQCGSVATWNNENNAQGMNCPMGYGGDELANF